MNNSFRLYILYFRLICQYFIFNNTIFIRILLDFKNGFIEQSSRCVEELSSPIKDTLTRRHPLPAGFGGSHFAESKQVILLLFECQFNVTKSHLNIL